ncbi:Sulfite reductase [NADPH] flavoprotein alpha-component [Pseudonocardia sp. Ae406_Ps2]|uniref:diflavin oxidoreductase n=1 Tax=unclassified Pseudonocardia TaxID=2619320 RepID=UPI0009664496|nr:MULTISPECIES: sulfite reductase flavoprotein subunit alpha [unclassified Pseudonocardia]OLL96992.1 Sulfite reductase [NADPH] flavoprotein alpha-component [Pseudonocardia sp. Ae331_Ps2]OLM05298.1 Sulfite reductase [NADPH] flavoprotein alpha-component [Pseudonocardia sp. Ae406_Ps2]OLM09887.1 Sulfite reductase [NADPH] flavoprotein alpha-component [Pseudonocardia sp. Ae505_Ps2]OLM26868.1 Sulfite reductase [NADPH] flavoprotein alpha-component [Pseudonocardia sp. Ae706_Ps2]OLM33071.1 Sulfite redu
MIAPPPPAELGDLAISPDAPFTAEQRIWLSGYLAGARSAAAPVRKESGMTPVHVLYGTETGNAEYVADLLTERLTEAGVPWELHELDAVDADALAAMSRVVVVCSTYGDGEMPDNADLFRKMITADDAPRLDAMSFAVCALGDESYEDFCAAGRLLDTRLAELGATRLLERRDCDVMWEDASAQWFPEIVAVLSAAPAAEEPAPAPAPVPEPARRRERPAPVPAVLAHRVRLSGPASDKEIHHHEFDLTGTGLTYAAGDSLNVVPANDPALVEALLDHLGHDGDTPVGDRPLRELLTCAHEIVTPSRDLLEVLAERAADAGLRAALREDRAGALWDRDLLGLLHAARVRLDPEEFVGLLRPLQHRAYSISSSPLLFPDRVHLTVASVRYRCDDRAVGGVCSTHLADRLAVGDTAVVSLQPNTGFRPPADDVDMIMIGPGTGVAPFRAFLQERAARGARGRNWLLFGDRRSDHDFLYRSELLGWASDGLLAHLDLAFSRDQPEKVYVQDRMREHGARLYAWLKEGAHLYVCGDASRMARDVDAALHEILAAHTGGEDGAAEFVADLKRGKRYLRDVY